MDAQDLTEFEQEELDRPRGILTKEDRELLMGLTDELGERAEEQRWVRLRRRVRNGLLDAEQLQQIPPKQRRLIFAPRGDEEVAGGALVLFRFLYLGLKEIEDEFERPLPEVVGKAVQAAETEYARERGEFVSGLDIRYIIDRGETVDIEAAREKLHDPEQRDSLTPTEIDALLSATVLDKEEWDMLREVNKTRVDETVDQYDVSSGVLDMKPEDDAGG